MVRCVLMLVLALAGPRVSEPPGEPEPGPQGLWPTERMIELMVRRTALEAADRYELTDQQYRQVETQMLERWTKFMGANRADLQPLINEYVEARLSVEPPTREQVRAWASRALPMADKLRRHIETGNQEIRRLLTPLQRVKFDSESLRMKGSIEAWHERLHRWQRGEFAETEFWDRPVGYEARGGRHMPTTGPASQGPPDQIEVELDRWDRYVADFIATHRLDEAQQRAATSILREVKDRARARRDRNRLEIQRLEQAIDAGRKQDEAGLKAELACLYGPIDALFTELGARLNRIPTESQRRTATQPAE